MKADAAPTLVGLVLERSHDFGKPRFFHRGEMSELLALEEFGSGVIVERNVCRSTKDDEFIGVELIGRFGRARFSVSH